MTASGKERLSEIASGAGCEKGFSSFKKLDLIGVEYNNIESLKTDLTFYPAEIISQPFGEGTKIYNFFEAVHMLYDLEPYSGYKELRDPLFLITQKPNKG